MKLTYWTRSSKAATDKIIIKTHKLSHTILSDTHARKNKNNSNNKKWQTKKEKTNKQRANHNVMALAPLVKQQK